MSFCSLAGISYNVLSPPEPRSGLAQARMRRSREGCVTSCAMHTEIALDWPQSARL